MLSPSEVSSYADRHRNEAVQFLQECLQAPSVTGSEMPMAQVVSQWIKKAGLKPQCYMKADGRPNILAEWKGSKAGKRFVFNGHMDVFPPVKGDSGMYGPWSGKIVDGYIYGRGSTDMKSGLCASIMAVKFLKDMGYDPVGSILLTCVCDEENCGNFGTKYLISEGLIQGDFGVCMEPTYHGVVIEHSGNLRVRVTYHSCSGHTSRPHPSADALTKCVDAIEKLRALNEKIKWYSAEIDGWSKLAVTMVESGLAPNMYASEGTFYIDYRLLPGDDIDEKEQQLRNTLDELREEKGNLDYSYKFEVLGRVPTLEIDPNAEIVEIARRAHEDITGELAPLHKRTGFSDAPHIVRATGMAMPNYGPGNEWEDICQPNEKVSLDDYCKFIKIYMMMVLRALGQS